MTCSHWYLAIGAQVGGWEQVSGYSHFAAELQHDWFELLNTSGTNRSLGNRFQTRSSLLMQFQILISFLVWCLLFFLPACYTSCFLCRESVNGMIGVACASWAKHNDSECWSGSDKCPDWDNQSPPGDLVVSLLINFNDNWISVCITQAIQLSFKLPKACIFNFEMLLIQRLVYLM